ncbi:hypothetical protein FRC02_003008 [Tulasnella sp. 418]|nr:hypothetical protein FRC02_003008 [Tulasnella sp. 418]
MPTLAPNVPLNAPANRPYDPAQNRNAGSGEQNKENDPAGSQLRMIHYRPTGTQVPVTRTSDDVLQSVTNVIPLSQIDNDTGAHIEEISDSSDIGNGKHDVNVKIYYEDVVSGGTKPKTKLKSISKSNKVVMEGITRVEFAVLLLETHSLEDRYAPHPDQGFPFKLWWHGMQGGKDSANTIERDADFEREVAKLLKKKVPVQLFASFDTTEMGPWIVRKRGAPSDFAPQPSGSSIPCLEAFSGQDRLHGQFIRQIEAANICREHPGEHGEEGHCYIGPSGLHSRLTNRAVTKWAAALAAGEEGVTIHDPPNCETFDGTRATTRPRGRNGPAQSSQSIQSEFLQMIPQLVAAITNATSSVKPAQPVAVPAPTNPTIYTPAPSQNVVSTGHPATGTHTPAGSTQPSSVSITHEPPPPYSAEAPTTSGSSSHIRPQSSEVAMSPIPYEGEELAFFIEDFRLAVANSYAWDFDELEAKLLSFDFGPDVLWDIPTPFLVETLEITHGNAFRLQTYARDWSQRLRQKLQRQQSEEV